MFWWQWAILGLVLIGGEIITLGGLGNFYFLFFGISALLVGLLVGIELIEAQWLQWCIFAALGVAALFVLRKPLQAKRSTGDRGQDPIDSIIGEVATLIEDIPIQGAGKAELRGSTWTVRNVGHIPLQKGQRSQVTHVDGLTLWVHAEPPTQEEHHVG